MSQPAKAPEPPIEEILASIRRSIVPDDDAGKPARKPVSRKPANRKSEAADGEGGSTGARGPEDGCVTLQSSIEPDGAAGHSDDSETATPQLNGFTTGQQGALRAAAPDGPLLSPHTSAVVDTAFNSLTNTVLSQNPRTLEDLVREMLKPMLKAWLDANLPEMVERLVRAEIERVSRRG